MLIEADDINNLLFSAGNAVSTRGKKYFEHSKVKVAKMKYENDSNFVAKSYVEGTYVYDTMIKKENNNVSFSCNCPSSEKRDTPCKHVIAMAFDMYIDGNKYISFKDDKKDEFFSDNINLEDYDITKLKKKQINDLDSNIVSDNLVKYYENLEIDEEAHQDIEILPKITLSGFMNEIEVSFKIGKEKKYAIKDLTLFTEAMQNNAKIKYGKDLEFTHNILAFSEDSKKLAKFITKKMTEYIEFSKLGNYYFTLNKRYRGKLKLKYSALDEFFEILEGKEAEIAFDDYNDGICKVYFKSENPPLNFLIKENDEGLNILHDISNYNTFYGQDYIYVLYGDTLYRCDDEFKKNVYPLIQEFKQKRNNEMIIEKKNATSFCEYIVPNLKTSANVNVSEDILIKYKVENLTVNMYFDIDTKQNVILKLEYVYGSHIINPLDVVQNSDCNRNIIEEKKVRSLLDKYHFVINLKRKIAYIANEEEIYDFLSDGLKLFTKKYKVFVTEKFKNRQIIKKKQISVGVKVDNGLLKLDINNLDLSKEELKGILKNYKLKKKYYRLKDGSFVKIDTDEMSSFASLVYDLNINESQISDGKIILPKYRAFYLNNILNNIDNISFNKTKEFDSMVNDILDKKDIEYDVPKSLSNVLRPYQITGFNFLKALDSYNFGGILADDMGLGKTIQIIALLLDKKESKSGTSIVVCPSSLYINWEKEIQKFAPSIKVLVISGNAQKREELINDIYNYDVVITSYDILKRDIEKYEKFKFEYIIADEAQYIKNNNTQNAKSLKKLNGKTRFALTGTPIENSLSELWSIFDFCMPGYLFNYSEFKERYENNIVKEENKDAVIKLRKIVAPFILRRVKKDVLFDLPDKTETFVYNTMNEKQEKLYNAYLLKAKKDMKDLVDEFGFEKSKIKILSIITRLRQLCCHPSLFIENYDGESSKFLQCIELIEEAVASSHKILLFSQFTSMFDILKKELEKRKINFLELTGKTDIEQRMKMVEKFNTDKKVQVFLISLKAGGTGLNLTGADMVIHYDPWWNLSVQNQATDRAYRIGQKNNIQVFKLITENSIEEKIQKIQERKMNITDNIVKTGENFITHMSKEDILELFE